MQSTASGFYSDGRKAKDRELKAKQWLSAQLKVRHVQVQAKAKAAAAKLLRKSKLKLLTSLTYCSAEHHN